MTLWTRLMPASLHGRLLLGMMLLVIAGLLGTDIAAYAMLQSFLASRVDRQLTANSLRAYAELDLRANVHLTASQMARLTPNNTTVLVLDARGRVLYPPIASTDPPLAPLVHALGALDAKSVRQRAGQRTWTTVGDTAYRVAYVPAAGPVFVTGPNDSGTPIGGVVIAYSSHADKDTLAQLAGIEAIVTAVAVLALTASATMLLRRGLRPLDQMATVAAAVADGQTDRRVPHARHGTEVNRLAKTLNQAFDERQHAEDRLRRFVADASHELRTPLTTIRGWAELYFQDGPPNTDAVHTAMSRIADEATRMSSLVGELLLLAQLDQQRPLELTPVDMVAVIHEVVADARVVDPTRTITVNTRNDHTVVRGDADRLRQVVRNLVGNALQHTPPGTAIRITVENHAAAGHDKVCLSVADDGPGIPEKVLPHLFERFYRADLSRNHTGGVGLGLPIARAIVQAHHGTVDVRGEPGHGTVFRVTLPRAASPTGP
jgi:two-component system OmpR family sensor kinase